ncbi:hypothetical protein D3C73_1450710 [compost metagenome]
MQMSDQLGHNLFPGALRHFLLHEVAFFIDIETVAPEYPHMLRLIAEMRLIGQHDGHQPGRILERNESARSRAVP